MKNVKKVMTAVGMAIMSAPAMVFADGVGTGTLDEVLNSQAGQQITSKLGPIFSAVLNVAFAAFAIGAVVKAVFAFVKSRQTDNSSEQKQLEGTAKNALIAAAIAVVGTLVVNLILGAFGVGFFNFAS